MKRFITLTAVMALLSSVYLTSSAADPNTGPEKQTAAITAISTPCATATANKALAPTHGKVTTARMDMFVIKPDHSRMDTPSENSNGKRTLVVDSILVQYPKEFAIVNVQNINGAERVTMDRGAQESERYATAWVNLNTQEVKRMLLAHAKETYKLQTEPADMQYNKHLRIVWQGIASEHLGKTALIAPPTALRVANTTGGN